MSSFARHASPGDRGRRGSHVGVLLQPLLGSRVEARLFRDGDAFHAPHLLDVEVAQGLRRLVRAGDVLADRAEEVLADLSDFDLRRHAHVDLLGRAWTLGNNLSAYDAIYVALAQALDARVVTCDRPLAAAPGIEVIR